MAFYESAKSEHEKEMKDKIDTYTSLIEVSRRTIEREKLQIENYEAKIKVLRESLEALKSAQLLTRK